VGAGGFQAVEKSGSKTVPQDVRNALEETREDVLFGEAKLLVLLAISEKFALRSPDCGAVFASIVR
jgi:hypothetical protein